MKSHMNRRDFLKWAALLPLLTLCPPQLMNKTQSDASRNMDTDSPNVLILVFDTLSALHISLYGYIRNTMPHLTRFAENATVFHEHYSAGNYTVPGTASIFTGTYPWTHHALSHQSTVLEEFTSKNIFSLFGEQQYTRIGFSHNLLANILLHDLRENLDEFVLPNEIALVDYNFTDNLFPKDWGLAVQSERNYLKKSGKLSDSLFLFPLFWYYKVIATRNIEGELRQLYPRGVPGYHDLLYPLENTIDWLMHQLQTLPHPYIAYIHVMPPHNPYNPRRDFIDIFNDDWTPAVKPTHFYSEGHSYDVLIKQRRYYDEYIAYADAEFGRLYDFMQENRMLENTYVVFTSDHGEMFERGIWKHTTPTLFQPIIRVPLLISRPHQKNRQDIYKRTSSIDLLPTLLHLTNQSIPEWCEGEVLPPFNSGEYDDGRSIYAIEAKTNSKYAPITKSTIALMRDQYKLIYYSGYPEVDDVSELFDLENDPEELRNLSGLGLPIESELKNELLETVHQKNSIFT